MGMCCSGENQLDKNNPNQCLQGHQLDIPSNLDNDTQRSIHYKSISENIEKKDDNEQQKINISYGMRRNSEKQLNQYPDNFHQIQMEDGKLGSTILECTFGQLTNILNNKDQIKQQIIEPILNFVNQDMRQVQFSQIQFENEFNQKQNKELVQCRKQQMLFGTEQSTKQPNFYQSQPEFIQIYKYLPDQIRQQIEQLGIYEPEQFLIYEGVKYEFQKFSDGQIYEGQMYGYKKHGYGYHFAGRSFYEGYFENDQRTGCGREVFQNGDFKIGNWKENKIEGYGILKQIDNQYFGEWVKDQPNGLGILENKNFKYEGDFQSGKLHGYGQKLNFLDSSKYIGQFQENRMHGQGILIFKDKVYKGLFFNNKFEGQGEMLYSDGSKYEGMYKNNFRDGKGKMIMADGSIKLDGEWFQDEFKQ